MLWNSSCKMCSMYIEQNIMKACWHTVVVPHLPCGLVMYTEAIDCTLCTCTHDHMCACVCTHMNGCIKVCYNMSFCIKGHRQTLLLSSLGSHFCFEFRLMFHVEMAWRNKQGCIKQCQDEDKAHSHSCFLLRAACKGAHIFNKIT